METYGTAVAAAARRLAEAGVEEPRREAIRLVASLAGLDPAAVLHAALAPLGERLEAEVLALVARRASGEPLAYVSGWAGFRHLLVQVDSRVLIPRPETEGLVELVLAEAPGGRVVDVGTGSGCIALSLAAEGHYQVVFGVDRESGALRVAQANADRLGLPVRFAQGDLLGPFRETPAWFDVVVSNPPYLTTGEWEVVDPAVGRWEPRLALDGGPDGLVPYRRLVTQARTVVRPGGLLALEVDHLRAEPVAELARTAGWTQVRVLHDLYGRDRYVTARRSE